MPAQFKQNVNNHQSGCTRMSMAASRVPRSIPYRWSMTIPKASPPRKHFLLSTISTWEVGIHPIRTDLSGRITQTAQCMLSLLFMQIVKVLDRYHNNNRRERNVKGAPMRNSGNFDAKQNRSRRSGNCGWGAFGSLLYVPT